MNNLSAIDLNLLVVLEALLAERHVSRAAMRLNRSQPAVSHALNRLRHLLADPLLVRHGGRLEPTARALEIEPQLADALNRMRQMLSPPEFDPSTARRTFRIAMSDYGAAVVLPALMPVLRAQAPLIDLIINQASRDVMMAQVMDGEIDLALGVFPDLAPSPRSRDARTIRSTILFKEGFACAADAAGLTGGALDLEAYLARPHALVAYASAADSEVDEALAAIGHQRRICLTLPHWSVAPALLADTDLVLTVARRILTGAMTPAGLTVFAPPFPIPALAFTQIWRQSREGDAGHDWLRSRIQAAAAASDPAAQHRP
jgi:DNA-binding transcriptional LysR family regulator